MTRAGVVSVRLSRELAMIAERIIRERTTGANLDETPFPRLHEFAKKLQVALKRRRAASNDLVLSTLTRAEVQAGYRYLMLFSHEDVPGDYLTYAETDAVHEIALELLLVLSRRRGHPGLTVDEIKKRIEAFEYSDTENAVHAVDERFAQRLKKRKAAEVAFWSSGVKRPPVSAAVLALLAPPRNTKI